MSRPEWRRKQKAEERRAQADQRKQTTLEQGYAIGFIAGKKQEQYEMAGFYVRLYTTASVAAIRGLEKWGKVKMKRYLDTLNAQVEDIIQGCRSEPQLRAWIKKEIDIDLDEYTGGDRMDVLEKWKEEHPDKVIRNTGNVEKLWNSIGR